jgi:hypothetical protein
VLTGELRDLGQVITRGGRQTWLAVDIACAAARLADLAGRLGDIN